MLLTAEQAKIETSKRTAISYDAGQLAMIEAGINQAIEAGQYGMIVAGGISANNRETLKKLGYQTKVMVSRLTPGKPAYAGAIYWGEETVDWFVKQNFRMRQMGDMT